MSAGDRNFCLPFGPIENSLYFAGGDSYMFLFKKWGVGGEGGGQGGKGLNL